MNLGEIRNHMEVYHETYGFCRVVSKRGVTVTIERQDVDPDDDDDEDEDDEIQVRAHSLTRKSHMSPALRAAATARKEKRAKELQEQRLRDKIAIEWKASLPEIPAAVQDHLNDCCMSGMMSFFNFINTDPDALDKLRKHSHYLVRDEIHQVESTIETLEKDLTEKKSFMEIVKSIAPKFKVPVLEKTGPTKSKGRKLTASANGQW